MLGFGENDMQFYGSCKSSDAAEHVCHLCCEGLDVVETTQTERLQNSYNLAGHTATFWANVMFQVNAILLSTNMVNHLGVCIDSKLFMLNIRWTESFQSVTFICEDREQNDE